MRKNKLKRKRKIKQKRVVRHVCLAIVFTRKKKQTNIDRRPSSSDTQSTLQTDGHFPFPTLTPQVG